ncbi:MAG: hypothetical protein WAW80_03660 [Candidatus Saccharimonadales bacterium]
MSDNLFWTVTVVFAIVGTTSLICATTKRLEPRSVGIDCTQKGCIGAALSGITATIFSDGICNTVANFGVFVGIGVAVVGGAILGGVVIKRGVADLVRP